MKSCVGRARNIKLERAIPRILEILGFIGSHFDLIDCVPVGLSARFRFARFNPHIKVNPGPSHARHWHKMYTELRLVDISITATDWRYRRYNHYRLSCSLTFCLKLSYVIKLMKILLSTYYVLLWLYNKFSRQH